MSLTAVLKFFAITYAVSWSCFIAAAALHDRGPAALALRFFLLLLGTFAPSLVAMGLTGIDKGRAGLEVLLRGLFDARPGMRWFLFAATYMLGIKLAVALLLRAATGTWPRFELQALLMFPVALVLSTPVQAGEEIGWRGYALPRMAARMRLGPASVVLGAVWMLWHLPLFYVPGLDNYGQSFPAFFAGGIALSVAIAWLYAGTRGSLLLAMVMHSAVNQAVGIVPSATANASNPWSLKASPVAWLTDALLWAGAVYFLVRMRRMKWPSGA